MKKLGVVAALVAACMLTATAHAAPAETIITGNVTDHGQVVPGAKVMARCNSPDLKEAQNLTDEHGVYTIIYAAADCPVGSNVQVIAWEGARWGVIHAEVKLVNNISIAIANIGIPEYNLASGILAAGAGIGVMAFVRRRYAHNRLLIRNN